MQSVDISLKDLSVMIAMPTTRDLHPLTVRSILATQEHCLRLQIPFNLGFVTGCGVVHWARDEAVDLFLKSEANRCFWVDSDVVWESKDFIRLLALSTKVPVVCGAYPAKVDDTVTFYMKYEGDTLEQGELGLVPIQGIGLGFTCMRREVIEALVAKAPQRRNEVNGYDLAAVFRTDIVNGNGRGEDIAFFHDVRQAGYPVYLDPEVSLGHIGTKVFTGSIKDAFQFQK